MFDARHCSHHTEAWHGRRVVLVAYTIRHVASLSREHKAFLEQCGVKVPGTAPEDVALVPAKFVGFSPYPSLGKRAARPSKPPLTSPKVPPPAEGSLGSPGLGHGERVRNTSLCVPSSGETGALLSFADVNFYLLVFPHEKNGA